MNPDSSTSDDEKLYSLVRSFDEAIASGEKDPSSTVASPRNDADLPEDIATEFDDLRHCVELLEDLRHRGGDASRSAAAADGNTGNFALPQRVGRFELRREIGRGACGVVFCAHDPQVGRDVAIKIPRPETLLLDDLRRRFLQEARAAGHLDHPHVVPVFEVGQDGPICYIAAAYVEGPSLADWLREQHRAVDPREAAELVATLADALEHAHARGVIHRDLKPANVLLQPLAEKPDSKQLSSFAAKVTDFGLAKLHETSDGATRSGMAIGTPAYMAPEQAQGRLDEIGPATDVYALGAILYESLSGQPPLRGESDVDTLRRIVTDEVPLVRVARPGVPRDIEAICLKCLEKRPAQRYARAAELASDLRRYLSGETTHARPIGLARRAARFVRRRPTVAALLAVSLLSMLVLVAGTLFYNARLAAALTTAQSERNRAEAESLNSRRLLYSAEVRLAYNAWHSLNRARTLELLKRQVPGAGEKDLREFAWHWLWGQCHAESRRITGHEDEVFAVAFSPDGRSLASASKDGTAKIWDADTGRLRHDLRGHETEVTCLAYSPDGRRLATGSEDRSIILWDVDTGQQVRRLTGHEHHLLTVAFSPDGKQLASGGRGNFVRLWEVATGRQQRTLGETLGYIRRVVYSPDGKLLIACDEQGAVLRWNTDNWQAKELDVAAEGSLFALDVTADSKTLFTAGRDSVIYRCDLDEVAAVPLTGEKNRETWIRDLRVSPSGDRIVTVNHAGLALVWDISRSSHGPTDEPLAVIRGHANRLWSAAWSPDGQRLATAGADRTIRIWNVNALERESPYPDVNGWVWDIEWLGTEILVATLGGVVHSYDSETGRHLGALAGGAKGLHNRLAVSPDGSRVATACERSNSVRVLDRASGELLFQDDRFPGGIYDLEISPDGSQLAVAADNRQAVLLELLSGRRQHVLEHDTEVDALAFSPDGRTLATCSRELRLWDVRTGTLLWHRRGYESDPRCAAFSPDGETIAMAIDNYHVVLVDAASGETRGTLLRDQSRANLIAYHPNGTTLAVAVNDPARILLWDMRTRQLLGELSADLASIFALRFSPDGRRLIAGGQTHGPQLTPVGVGRILEWKLPGPR